MKCIRYVTDIHGYTFGMAFTGYGLGAYVEQDGLH